MSAFKFQWVPHNGGPMPVSADTLVEVRYRDGSYDADNGEAFDWSHGPNDYDVIAYRVVEVRP